MVAGQCLLSIIAPNMSSPPLLVANEGLILKKTKEDLILKVFFLWGLNIKSNLYVILV